MRPQEVWFSWSMLAAVGSIAAACLGVLTSSRHLVDLKPLVLVGACALLIGLFMLGAAHPQ